MDPNRIVNTIDDLSLYPSHDPIRRFFLSKAVSSKKPAKYALEMNKGWFTKNGVKPNDVIMWDLNSTEGRFFAGEIPLHKIQSEVFRSMENLRSLNETERNSLNTKS